MTARVATACILLTRFAFPATQHARCAALLHLDPTALPTASWRGVPYYTAFTPACRGSAVLRLRVAAERHPATCAARHGAPSPTAPTCFTSTSLACWVVARCRLPRNTAAHTLCWLPFHHRAAPQTCCLSRGSRKNAASLLYYNAASLTWTSSPATRLVLAPPVLFRHCVCTLLVARCSAAFYSLSLSIRYVVRWQRCLPSRYALCAACTTAFHCCWFICWFAASHDTGRLPLPPGLNDAPRSHRCGLLPTLLLYALA